MKKNLAVLLSLLLVLAAAFALAENALPQPGDVISGFEVREVGTFSLVNADSVLLEHQKTGALVRLLLNDDNNRMFQLAFRTPAESEKGTSHIFEHVTLLGSERYPSSSLFFSLGAKTYNTFMNAMTSSKMTTYPVSSLSEAQLLQYADFYTDSCLNPLIMTQRDAFDTEGWRYALSSADAPLTYDGTVYTEMGGSLDLESMAYYNAAKAAFPGSYYSNVTGGIPDVIPQLTWEDVTDYHSRYYHPSNSLAMLYGSFDDYTAFLTLLDGYYAAYDRREFTFEEPGYTPITEAAEAVYPYPVEAGSDTANGAAVYYSILCGDITEDEVNQLDLLTRLLNANGSPLMDHISKALPSVSAYCYVDIDAPEPAVLFVASGMNEEYAPLLRDTINAALKEVAENGFSAELIDSFYAPFALETKLMTETSDVGGSMLNSIAYYWAGAGDVYGYDSFLDALNRFPEYNDQGLFSSVTAKLLLDNPRTALVTTKPVPGLKEEQDQARRDKLVEIKAGMSKAEIDGIVKSTAARAANALKDDSAEYIKQLTAVTVESLPEEIREYDYTDETGDDGIRRLNLAANVDGVGREVVFLNMSHLSLEDAHYLQLYVDLMGFVGTASHSRTELGALIDRYLYSGEIRISVLNDANNPNGYSPYLCARWICTDDDIQASYDLVRELCFETQLTDTATIAGSVSRLRSGLKQQINEEGFTFMLNRAQARTDNAMAYYAYATQLDYYTFLKEVEAQLFTDPAPVLERLEYIRSAVQNRTGAISGYAGSADGLTKHTAVADAFLAALPALPFEPAIHDIPRMAAREGLAIDSAVNYNMIYASFEDMGIEDESGDLLIAVSLVNDMYLTPRLRDQYGTYGVIHGEDGKGVYLITYRDPNVDKTFKVYSMIPKLLPSLVSLIDQETVDGYIMSNYAYFAMSEGELSGALQTMLALLNGDDPQKPLKLMHDLKSVKPDDFAKFADMYKALIDNGVYTTVSSKATLTENAQLYDVILEP